jgi:hypothetical protein
MGNHAVPGPGSFKLLAASVLSKLDSNIKVIPRPPQAFRKLIERWI